MEDAVAVINSGRDEAVGESGGSVSGDGSGGDVELDVISVTMEAETMMSCDAARGKHVEDEEEWTKHRTLGDASGQTRGGGGAVVDVDELLCRITAAFNAFPLLFNSLHSYIVICLQLRETLKNSILQHTPEND